MSIQDRPDGIIEGRQGPISRRAFLGLGGATAAALMLSGSPLGALGARVAEGQALSAAAGYVLLVPKGELFLPAAFNYQVIDRQGTSMRDGRPTPGIFGAMGAFPDSGPGGEGTGKPPSSSATTRTASETARSR